VVCPVGSDGTVCTNGAKSITVPPGALPNGATLTITGALSQPPCPATPVGQLFLGECYKLEWKNADGSAVTALAKAVTDCLLYNSGSVALAGGNVDNLRIGLVYDPTTGQWTFVKPVVDSANSRVCTTLTQIAYDQALFAPAPTLPVTGGSPGVPGWIWLAVGGLAGLTLFLGGYRFTHRSATSK
jgi:hypothetical protein